MLGAAIEDDETHARLAMLFVGTALARFHSSTLPSWRQIAQGSVEPQLLIARQILAATPAVQQSLEAWPDLGRAQLGLFSPQRQALVCLRTLGNLAPAGPARAWAVGAIDALLPQPPQCPDLKKRLIS